MIKPLETFAKPSDVDAVQGVAAQRAQTYHVDRQASEQHTTQKCATDGSFAKVSACLVSTYCILGSNPNMQYVLLLINHNACLKEFFRQALLI